MPKDKIQMYKHDSAYLFTGPRIMNIDKINHHLLNKEIVLVDIHFFSIRI